MHSSMRTPAVVLLVVMAVVVGGVRAVVAVVSAMAVLSEVKQVSGVGMGVGMVKLGVVELVARACTLLGQVMFTRALPDEGLCLEEGNQAVQQMGRRMGHRVRSSVRGY